MFEILPGGMCVTVRDMADTPPQYYTVYGMTCEHCVLSVTEEVSEVAGVSDVDVDLASGRVAVTGAGYSDDAIAYAVAEAGYEVVR
jgi:copper chaperone CopZ